MTVRSPLALIALTSLFFAQPAFATFSDVPQEHPYVNAVYEAEDFGIVSGYPDGTFRPDATINRAEFVKIMMELWKKEPELATYLVSADDCFAAQQQQPDHPSYKQFSDVDYAAWYGSSVCQAQYHNVIQGDPAGTFRPADPINFAEMAKIIVTHYNFADVDYKLTPWYEPYVELLRRYRITPQTIHDMDHQVTRGEMVEMIHRLSWRSSVGVAFSDSSVHTIVIRPSSQIVGVIAAWENYREPENVHIELSDPEGTVYTEEIALENEQISYFPDMHGTQQKTFILKSPEPGIWTLRFVNAEGLGKTGYKLDYGRLGEPPLVTFTDAYLEDRQIYVSYGAYDRESDDEMTFVLQDVSDEDTLIYMKVGVQETDGPGSFTLDVNQEQFDAVSQGTFHVCAIIGGGGKIELFCSEEPLEIRGEF